MKTVSLSTSVPGIIYKSWDANNKKLTIKTTTNSTNDIVLQGGYLESKSPITDSVGLELAFIINNNFYYKILSDVNIITADALYEFTMSHNTVTSYRVYNETTTWEEWINSPYNDGRFTIDENTNKIRYDGFESIYYIKDNKWYMGCYKTDYILVSTQYGVNDAIG